MRVIRAVIRPTRADQVIDAWESRGIVSRTKMDVFGRRTTTRSPSRKQLTIVVEESKREPAIAAIQAGARTGHDGDGKSFVNSVDAVDTVRTRKKTEG